MMKHMKTVSPPPLPNPVRKIHRQRRIRKSILYTLVLLLTVGAVSCGKACFSSENSVPADPYQISPAVYDHESMIRFYARQYGIEEYMPVLLCIVQAESGGTAVDVMQSSESAGLPVNTLATEDSIAQGVSFFASLIEEGKQRGLDLPSVIQSYNYGRGFLKYVEDHGGSYSFGLAEQFAGESAHWQTVEYSNPIAIETNGGWRYAYGNMFYYPVVREYLQRIEGGLQFTGSSL